MGVPLLNTPVGALVSLVGQTPMLRIGYRLDGHEGEVFAKLESINMTGSIKDRMVVHVLDLAYRSGELRPGDTIVEASSGNTGIAFAAIGRALGHPVRIYMPDWMSRERVCLIENFGAEIVHVSADEGGFIGSVKMAERDAGEHGHVFLPRQFENDANTGAHAASTAPEIEHQLAGYGREIDAFVAGVGTGGTVMGVHRYFSEQRGDVRVHPLEPANSPTLRTGCRMGNHRIQGISDEFIPSLLDLESLDELVDVWDGDAILMAQKMCGSLGLGVGISSGANLLGAIRLAEELGAGSTVVTVLPDSNKKYLSTALCCDEPVEDRYLSPRIELTTLGAARSCITPD